MTLEPLHDRVRVRRATVVLGDVTINVEERSIPGQDDRVYEKNPKVWEEVTRGQANVRIHTTGSNEAPQLVCTLRGLRKFGYSDSKYGRRNEVESVVAIDKENGECAHVSAFLHNSIKYWVVGSKLVHMVLRDECQAADAQAPEYKDQRYRAASKVAGLFIAEMKKCAPEHRNAFFTYLASNGWTANAEAIFADSQHIVDYNGINQMRWFAISKDAPSSDGLCLSPEASKELFESCGLHAITRSPVIAYRTDAYNALIEQIGQRSNSEGVVMYGLDSDGKVVCLWKEKSYPYVMERIVREAIKRGMVGNELAAYIQSRLRQQKSELRKYFASWEEERLPMLLRFGAWMADKFPLTDKTRDLWAISCQWLSLQREFMRIPREEQDAIAAKYLGNRLTGVAAIASIVLVGPPGSGKSTLARSLVALLQHSGKVPVWLNQDEAGNRKAYLDAIRRTINNTETTHVILDKSNMEKGNRDDYVQLGLAPTMTVVFQHPDGPEALGDLCVARILARGNAHRSLCPANFEVKKQDAKKEIKKIIGSFLERGDMDDFMDETCVTVDATIPPEAALASAWEQLTTLDPSIPKQENLAAAMNSCAQLSKKYEALLHQLAANQQLYAAIQLDKANMNALLQHVPQAALAKKKLRDTFHITIKYFGGVIDPTWFVEHADKLNTTVQIVVTEIVYDARGAAAVVSRTFPCANNVPHITLACAQGVAPVYSNTLAVDPRASRVKVNITLSGTNVFM